MANDERESDGYEVGYKKPPRKNRFKPGQSGNPKGRPKGHKNHDTLLDEELQETVMITENRKSYRISKIKVIVKRLVEKAMHGDLNALKTIFALKAMNKSDGNDVTPHNDAEDLALIEAALKRHKVTK